MSFPATVYVYGLDQPFGKLAKLTMPQPLPPTRSHPHSTTAVQRDTAVTDARVTTLPDPLQPIHITSQADVT